MNIKQFKAKMRFVRILASEAGIELSEREAILFYFKSIHMTRDGWNTVITDPIVDTYAQDLDLADGKRLLGFLFFYLWQSARSGHWLVIQRDRNKASSIAKSLNIKQNQLLDIVDRLVAKGYVQIIIGRKGSAPISSRIMPTGKLLKDLSSLGNRIIELETETIVVDPVEPIICRAKKAIKASKATGWRSKWETYPTRMNKSAKSYKSAKTNIDTINQIIASNVVSIAPEGFELIEGYLNGVVKVVIDRLFSERLNVTDESILKSLDKLSYLFTLLRMRDLGTVLEDGSVDITGSFSYTRVFTKRITRVKSNMAGSMELGGRFYCSASSMPSKSLSLREHILINGNHSVEIDYSAQHFRIAASEANVELEDGFDPYWSEDTQWQDIFGTRLTAKLWMNALINSRSVGSAKKLSETSSDFSHINFSAALAATIQRMPWMGDILCSDAGVRLQNVDSRIAEVVMSEYVKKTGKAILCYHDSFIVDEADTDLLLDLMASASISVAGVAIPASLS